MNLRCDTEFESFGLLICSQETKLFEYESKPQPESLYLIKLERHMEKDESFIQEVFMQDENLYKDDLVLDYMSRTNMNIVKQKLSEIVKTYKTQC
jgi:hypothetical protein